MPYYPPINEKSIKHVARLYDEDPDYFEHTECPYSKEVIDVFKAGSKSNDFFDTDIEELDVSNFDEEKIISEVNALWTQLKAQGESMSKSETASERNTYFRLSVTLLEKVMSLKERAMNQQKMHEFSSAVLQIMEDELNSDQRTAVMERLNNILMRD